MIRVLHVHVPARSLLLGVTEGLLICTAFLAATLFHFGSDAMLALVEEHGIEKISLVAVAFFLAMYLLDLYDPKIVNNNHEVLSRLLQVLGVAIILLALVYTFLPAARLGRNVLVMGVLFAVPFLVVWRQLFFWTFRFFNLTEKTVIVGHNPLIQAIVNEVKSRPELGFDIIGYLDRDGADTPALSNLTRLGGFDALSEVVSQYRVKRLIVAMSERRGHLPTDELLALKTSGLTVQEGVNLYESMTGKILVESLQPGTLVFSEGFRVSRLGLFQKYCFAFVISLLGLLITAPLQGLIALLIWVESGSPVIFRQKRVGKHRKIFTLYKFRTMYQNADPDGQHKPAETDDPRCTRIGKWLRRLRLDELPQLYNVVRGEMDLVGPRPFVPDQEEELVREIPYYRYRWLVKPGVTGWAQVNRSYCRTINDNLEKLAYDLYYIKNISAGLDFVILFKTAKVLLLGRGAC